MAEERSKFKLFDAEQDFSGILSQIISGTISKVTGAMILCVTPVVWGFISFNSNSELSKKAGTQNVEVKQSGAFSKSEEKSDRQFQEIGEVEAENNAMLDQIEQRIEDRRQSQ